MAVGQALVPQQELRPQDTPQKSVGQAINPDGGRSKFKDIMGNPAMLALLGQLAASLASGRGIGQSLGDATGAMGRGAAAAQAFQTDEEREQRRRFESDREFELRRMQVMGLGGGGRGGGGGGGSGSGEGGTPIDEEELREFMLDRAQEEHELALEDAQLNGTTPPPPPNYAVIADEANRLATASRNGMNMRQYNDILEAGGEDAADDMVDAYRQGKEAGNQWVDGVLNWRPTPEGTPDDRSRVDGPGDPTLGGGAPGMPMPRMGNQAPSINAPQRNSVPDVTPNLPGTTSPVPPTATPQSVSPYSDSTQQQSDEEKQRRRRMIEIMGGDPNTVPGL